MQLRAIMLVDVDIPDFTTAAKLEQRLHAILEEIKDSNRGVTYTALDIKERRGNAKPDIKNMAFRQNKPVK